MSRPCLSPLNDVSTPPVLATWHIRPQKCQLHLLPLSIYLTVLATSVIRSQKNLFGSVTMLQMSGNDIAAFAY